MIEVRRATPADAVGMARVHVAAWQETYRGQMPDDVLDDPQFIGRRTRYWTAVLTDPAYQTQPAAVAVADGQVVGIALARPPRDDDAAWPIEVSAIYALKRVHGGPTGQQLLDFVIGEGAADLWVAADNPRAQAFYRRNRFSCDGATKDEGIPQIRMVRPARGPLAN